MSTHPDRHAAVFPNELENREEGEALAIEHGERAPAPFPGERPDAFDVDPPEDRDDPEDTEDIDDDES